MNENNIRQMIRQEIQNDKTSAQYNVSKVPYHTHNSIDSPLLANTNIPGPTIYTGFVLAAGTAGSPFPAGWSVAHLGTGQYAITHNLGTTAYTVDLQITNFSVTMVEAVASIGGTNFGANMLDIQNFPPPYNFRNQDFFFTVIVP